MNQYSWTDLPLASAWWDQSTTIKLTALFTLYAVHCCRWTKQDKIFLRKTLGIVRIEHKAGVKRKCSMLPSIKGTNSYSLWGICQPKHGCLEWSNVKGHFILSTLFKNRNIYALLKLYHLDNLIAHIHVEPSYLHHPSRLLKVYFRRTVSTLTY